VITLEFTGRIFDVTVYLSTVTIYALKP
jgi:hypothetical protein